MILCGNRECESWIYPQSQWPYDYDKFVLDGCNCKLATGDELINEGFCDEFKQIKESE